MLTEICVLEDQTDSYLGGICWGMTNFLSKAFVQTRAWQTTIHGPILVHHLFCTARNCFSQINTGDQFDNKQH